jgi:hypothetical protein
LPESSSFQFYMNKPAIDSPWRLSSRAATEESTPPDTPTITRGADGRSRLPASRDIGTSMGGIIAAA